MGKVAQQSSQSSKMMDSQAKNSEDYESDFFDENTKQPKNAHDYFQEEDAKMSGATPLGGNPNSDGGSIFNQTGGQFLSRGHQNQTKSSIQQHCDVAPAKNPINSQAQSQQEISENKQNSKVIDKKYAEMSSTGRYDS